MDAGQPLAIGIGEVLWDLLPAGKQLGGAPANFAYHAGQLGARAAIISAVGQDALGDEIVHWARRTLQETLIDTTSGHPTGTVSVTLDAAGVPTYVIHQPVAWDFLPLHISPEFASRADIVCFGSIAQRSPQSRTAIREFLGNTRRDCLRIFDINLRQNFYDEDAIRQSLEQASILKINDQEMPIVAEMFGVPKDEHRAAAQLIERFNLRMLALTRGPNGSSLYTREQANHHLGYAPEKLADTIGAGDAFAAAVAMGVYRGKPLDRINVAANRLASYVCSQSGAMPPVPASLAASLA